MRIDGPKGYDASKIQPGSSPSGQAGGSGPAAEASAQEGNASGAVGGGGYVRKALALPETDAARIAEARELLASGQLDTPESIARAAEAMTRLGI